MKRKIISAFFLVNCLLLGMIGGWAQKYFSPPPAIVVICGENGNGVTVLNKDVDNMQETLFAQGCFYSDQRVISLGGGYSFVFGTKVLIGE